MEPTSPTPPTGPGRQDRTRLIIAALGALVGVVWMLQGLGVPIGGSFMVGDLTWTWIGGVLVLGALLYAGWPRLRRS